MQSTHKYQGLSPQEVQESRARHGTNVFSPKEKVTLWRLYLAKLQDPLILILMVACMLSFGISLYEYFGLRHGAEVFFEPLGILVAILLATGLAFYFEKKADSEFALLNTVNDDEAVQVYRDGHVQQVPRRDIVVGDIVFLSTGNEVPADGKLVESTQLSIDESTLTGEPICRKSSDPEEADPEATFPTDHAMRGTKVMEGHGVMEVFAVGDETENGKVHEAAGIDDSVRTPLNEQLDRLGRLITRISYALAALIVVGRVGLFLAQNSFEWVSFSTYLLQTIMIAVTLIVVAVPEGLPMAVTLALAYSMRRMLQTNNLVRKMHACETMGATTVICTDKTGTLTCNQMRVHQMDLLGDAPEALLYQSIASNSTAHLDSSTTPSQVLGNPTEGALLLYLQDQGVDYAQLRAQAKVVGELPFSTERKYMATEIETADGEHLLCVKGAPEIIYSLCADTSGMSPEAMQELLSTYQSRAMRTIAFAYAEVGDATPTISGEGVVHPRLKLLAVAAISDPVRSDVPAAMHEVLHAGIQVKVVTGDTSGTAREIGRQIGLWDDAKDGEEAHITGSDFAALSDEEMLRRLPELKIISRARPLDKRRLVEGLQQIGEVVAVTGDGTNDAPALKAAHVGLSMGDGTSVAKEASDITIIDNSFASIGRAVMWGRSLFRNIRRFLLFQMTVNVVACLIVLFGAFIGTHPPLTVTQMLWVNLIMDTFAAMALASLPPTPEVMQERPRSRHAFIISRGMWQRIVGMGGLFFVLLLGWLYILEQYQISSLTDLLRPLQRSSDGLTTYEGALFFTTFVFLHFWNMFNARAYASGCSALHFKGCSGFVLISLLIIVGQVLIVSVGGSFFSVAPLSLTDWGIIIVATSAVLWIGELYRLIVGPKHT